MKETALWISPDNKIIGVTDTHIVMVMTHPEKFGLTKKYIEDTFKKYKEIMGTEGHARDEILTEVLKKGWIRIRVYKTPTRFDVSFQVYDFKPEIINRIEKVIKIIVKKKIMDENLGVVILNKDASANFLDKEDELTLAEIAAGAMRDKKYVKKSDAEEAEAKGEKRYTSLATMYHENVKFTFLKSIEEYKSYNSYLDKILNEEEEGK